MKYVINYVCSFILLWGCIPSSLAQVAAVAVNSDGSTKTSSAHFVLHFNGETNPTNVQVTATTPLTITTTLTPDSADIGSRAELLIAALYTSTEGAFYSFSRTGNVWQAWDGQISTLPTAETITLAESQSFSVIEQQQLTGMAGQFLIAVGYRLADGSVAYNGNNFMQFTLNKGDEENQFDSTTCNENSTHIEQVVCMSEAFLATLTDDEKEQVLYDWSDSTAKTTWSNLPNVNRNGLMFGNLDEDSLAAAHALAATVLSKNGYEDFLGVLALDDYLNTLNGSDNGNMPTDGTDVPTDMGTPPDGTDMPTDMGTPPDGTDAPADMGTQPEGGGNGLSYSSDNYYIAFIGTPAVQSNWMIQIGGHHLAYNITYLSGAGYPTPNHIGAEPKASLEISSQTYAPLEDEGNALVAMFNGLDSTQLAQAYLADQVFADILIGPDNGSGVLPTDYPTPSEGLLVSELNAEQQALVIAAIEQWVRDYPAAVADVLMADYTSETAFAQTRIAWAGTESAGVDVDVSGTYMRIDGPRLWIEVACQSGVIIRDETHYHTMYRDKTMDYGNSL